MRVFDEIHQGYKFCIFVQPIHSVMITITINKRTKAGKLLFEMAKLLSEKEKSGVTIEEGKPRYNKETETAIKEARNRKTSSVDLENFRKELYS